MISDRPPFDLIVSGAQNEGVITSTTAANCSSPSIWHNVPCQAISGSGAAYAAEPAAATIRFPRSSPPGRAGKRGCWRMFCFRILQSLRLCDERLTDEIRNNSAVSMLPSEPLPPATSCTVLPNPTKSPIRRRGSRISSSNTPPSKRSLSSGMLFALWLWKRSLRTDTCSRVRVLRNLWTCGSLSTFSQREALHRCLGVCAKR